ncbi:hypothetical protein RHGRI_021812 [Rhododendron griersonianum]|uniref:PORR domain-containing protein n=1 Tax=Rhododendron griersonianum TaxID=479676 RepID=A0AAV6JLT3_9ERIC|nr:hypothetical protein RHGRI_021812 [Rhododendron griersonianum]
MQWLEEWQRLPYTSPYLDASHLDPRTDRSEKRIVGVFHEFLHLTIQKKTGQKNVSNLRKPLDLPQKFTKVFERHPGIFYVSKKSDTQTVVFREAYDRQQLIQKHPLVDIRARTLEPELQWGIHKRVDQSMRSAIFMTCLAATIYRLWRERNFRIFQHEGMDTNAVTKKVWEEVRALCLFLEELAQIHKEIRALFQLGNPCARVSIA